MWKKRLFLCLASALVLISALQASVFRPEFALVLSGGGAKGLAHIPVLKELDRRGIVPDMVVGTSMGAVIGAFYAAGYTGEEIEAIVTGNDISEYFFHLYALRGSDTIPSPFAGYDTNLLTIEFGHDGIGSYSGVIDDQYLNGLIRRYLAKVLDIRDFDKLPIPFRAVGTDITNKRKVVFSSGSLFDAIRASMALPVLFSPVRLEDGSYIMDGGLEDNLPIDVAEELGADVILAVDVNDVMHIYGRSHSMETLSGAFSAFADYLTEPNSMENYRDADWVIIPDVNDFTATAFSDAEAIIGRGEEAVAESQFVFDELEEKLGGHKGSRKGYGSMEAPLIERIAIDGNLPRSAGKKLSSFEGRRMDYDTILRFEKELDEIRQHSGLKSVTYSMTDGVIEVTAEHFPSLSGAISLGLTGGIGIRYDGERTFFVYTPEFTLSGTMALLSSLNMTYGVKVDRGILIDAGISYPFLSSMFLYSSIGLKYGQLSYLSLPGTSSYIFGNDVGLFFQTGIGYTPFRSLRLDLVLAFEYSYLSGLEPYELGRGHFLYPYAGLGIVFDRYDETDAASDGFEMTITGEIGGDFPSSTLSYAIHADFCGVIGPTDIFKFIFEGQTDSIRRPIDLAEAFAVTNMGRLASDYIYAMGGFRIPLPASMYVDAGIFFELFGHDHDAAALLPGPRSLIPYSELDAHNMDIGGYFAFGLTTSFGKVGFDLYISATPRVSLMFGID